MILSLNRSCWIKTIHKKIIHKPIYWTSSLWNIVGNILLLARLNSVKKWKFKQKTWNEKTECFAQFHENQVLSILHEPCYYHRNKSRKVLLPVRIQRRFDAREKSMVLMNSFFFSVLLPTKIVSKLHSPLYLFWYKALGVHVFQLYIV